MFSAVFLGKRYCVKIFTFAYVYKCDMSERNIFWLLMCLAYRSAVLEGLKKDIANRGIEMCLRN